MKTCALLSVDLLHWKCCPTVYTCRGLCCRLRGHDDDSGG